jgi:hypothetical protein
MLHTSRLLQGTQSLSNDSFVIRDNVVGNLPFSQTNKFVIFYGTVMSKPMFRAFLSRKGAPSLLITTASLSRSYVSVTSSVGVMSRAVPRGSHHIVY